MKVRVQIKQSEINRVIATARIFQANKRTAIATLVEETATAIGDDARSLAPSDSGKLQENIKVMLGSVADKLVAYVVADRFYARFVEIGTVAAAAHPFMVPAAEAHLKDFLQKLRAILANK